MPATLRAIADLTHPETGDVIVPNSPDGRRYHYLVYMPGGDDVVFTDQLEDTLDFLIPGYGSDMDDTQRAVARIQLADSIARSLQAQTLSTVSRDALTEEEWAIVNAPRIGSDATHAPWWRSPVPLFVVETSYTPYTDLPRPASAHDGSNPENLRWIRPAEEEDFLLSLHEVGFLRVMENTSTASDDAVG